MAKAINRLTARTVQTISESGRHADGNGLYLVVDKAGADGKGGAKRWVYLFREGKRLREMGLGGLASVSLAEARVAAEAARKARGSGQDPIAQRRAGANMPLVETFGHFADELVTALAPGFRNAKHIAQWRMTLSIEKDEAGDWVDSGYCTALRPKALDKITTEDVLGVLRPIWQTKPETASRVRGRIERVLDAAKAKGLRSGENPAAWRGHLANLLPKRKKLSRGHHAALAYSDVPSFMAELRGRSALAARALEFTVYTAARSGETLGARWSEIDRENWVWTVPANRMKAGRIHRVPLSGPAQALLKSLAAAGAEAEAFVFPGNKKDRPLSVMSMEMVLRRMKRVVTVHGFRSSFRDWCFEESAFPSEIAEAALAHVTGDATERAYRRGDALKKRGELMDAWAGFCSSPATKTKAPEGDLDLFE